MWPDPLHPAVVHLPLALSILLPGLALLGVWAIGRGYLPVRSWLLIVLLQALLVGSGWLAAETGEEEEDRVERIVAERHIEFHEEAAEGFLVVAGLSLLATGAGLLPGRSGSVGRIGAAVVLLAVFASAIRVGHSGGELVYVHGAASAYAGGDSADAVRRHPDDD